MKTVTYLGILTLLLIGGSSQVKSSNATVSSPNLIAILPPNNSVYNRDVFYFSKKFGFRFTLPRDFSVIPQDQISPNDKNILEILEIWSDSEYINYQGLTEKPMEMPPLTRLIIYGNPNKLPLENWQGELSSNRRQILLGNIQAIAYSATGLYESDHILFSSADGKYIFHLQSEYLTRSGDQPSLLSEIAQSFIFDVGVNSEINYTRLAQLLAAGKWQEADLETRAIIQRLAFNRNLDLRYNSQETLGKIPCNEFRTIDALWTQASKGRFGYSIQQQIWQKIPPLFNRTEAFGQQVGWRSETPLHENNGVGMEISGTFWRLDTGLNYTSNAPVGQFPWIGISSSALSELIDERSLGCGSCTVDAMELSDQRFVKYIPALFNRLEQCLCKPKES